ncbi:hypothetical protein P692DRAFT_20876973 [Suillus brevipes Sb2]|nr:hypothetical protein P692DRAFT_20876973 [Suillus brevipes Sb2]
MKSYIRSTIGLLAMLLRTDRGDNYEIPIPHQLMHTLQDLELALTEKESMTEKIHMVLTLVWMAQWVKEKNNMIPCPTERYMVLHTLEVDGRHREPVHITPDFAGLEYCIRLACLKQLKILSAELYDVSSIIHSLQDHESATHIVGGSQEMDGVVVQREIFASMETKLVDLWKNKVLGRVNIRVCYETIVDDTSNNDIGYYFLSDPRSTCFADHDRFLKTLINDPEAFSRFAVIRQGQLVWNKGALLQWLRDYAEFQKLVLARCEMLSGAPGRGTELMAMTYRNTKASTTS